MANKIEFTEFSPVDGFVASSSRYAKARIVYYGEARKIAFATYRKRSYPFSKSDKFTVVPPGMEFRPDMMSTQVYGVPDYWWRILEANDMKDIYEFKSGAIIRLPVTIS